jgi:hypothetical protein
VNGFAGPDLAPATVVLVKRLGVDEPRLDFPEPVTAQIAIAFDRTLVHQAPPLANILVRVGHLLLPICAKRQRSR